MRLPEIPSWFFLGVVVVGATVGALFMLSREEVVVEVSPDDKSMRPAIGDGKSFKVDTSWLAKPERNAIVAHLPPGGSHEPSVARVVALPGDVIEVRARKLYVNGIAGPTLATSFPAADVTCPAI